MKSMFNLKTSLLVQGALIGRLSCVGRNLANQSSSCLSCANIKSALCSIVVCTSNISMFKIEWKPKAAFN